MRFRWGWILSLVSVALLLSVAAAALEEGAVGKLSAYAFALRRGDVTLIADVDATRFRGGEQYIPMRVFLGKDEKGTLVVTRDSFALTDPKGAVHAPAPVEALNRDYGQNLIAADYHYDHAVVDAGYVHWHFDSYTLLPAPVFYVNPSGSPFTLHERGELIRRTYLGTFLYFPNPAGADPGTYTLTFSDPKAGVKVELPFVIPWTR